MTDKEISECFAMVAHALKDISYTLHDITEGFLRLEERITKIEERIGLRDKPRAKGFNEPGTPDFDPEGVGQYRG